MIFFAIARFAAGGVLLASLALVGCRSREARPEPPAASRDGEWLRDEEGREYRREALPKSAGHYERDGEWLKTPWGMKVAYLGEDEESFYFKIFRPAAKVARRPRTDPSAVAAGYDASHVGESDRLRFEPFDRGLPRSGQWRNGFRLADIDEDGHVDVVHGPPRKRPGPPIVFLGDGAGGWRRWTEASFPPGAYDYGDAEVADFDGDGRPDVALAMHLVGIAVLRNRGGGAFEAWSEGIERKPVDGEASSGIFSSRALAAVDWDRDGRMDLVALGEGPRPQAGRGAGPQVPEASYGIVLHRNLGSGRWQVEREKSPRPLFGDAIEIVDDDADDGRAFVVAAGMLGRKDVFHVASDDGLWEARELGALRPRSRLRAVTSWKLGERAALALAYASEEGGVWRQGIDVARRSESGAWTRTTLFAAEARTGPSALGAGDLDGDGVPELVALTDDGGILVFGEDASGRFVRERAPETERFAGCRGHHVEARDLDGDGRDDVVASFAGEEQGLGPTAEPGCPGGGSLRAWRSLPAAGTSGSWWPPWGR